MGRDSGTHQRAGNVANIPEGLVIAEYSARHLIAGVINQQSLSRRKQGAIRGPKQKTQNTQLQRILHKGHRDQQQHGNQQHGDKNTFWPDTIAQFSQPGSTHQRSHAGHGGDQPADKSQILDLPRQLPDIQRQDGGYRSCGYLNNQRGDKERHHQFWLLKRDKDLMGAKHVLFLYRNELFPHRKQRHHKTDKQHASGDKEHRTQTETVRQQATNQWSNQRAADRAGREPAQRPAAFIAGHLSSNQRIGVGHKSPQQPQHGPQRQKLPD